MKGSWEHGDWEESAKRGKIHAVWTLSSLRSQEKKGLSSFSVPVSLAFLIPLRVVLMGLWSPGAPGLQKAVPSSKVTYCMYPISFMLGIVFPSTPEAGLPGFLPGHCTLWNMRIRVIYYQHLPLQAADQFPFLQMALTGQPKKALLAICFLLPFQAG